jgi:hypothetical protein
MRLQVAALALAAGSAAQTSQWQYIMTTAGKHEPVLIDSNTLQRLGQSIRLWEKIQHQNGSYSLVQESIDCEAGTWTLLYEQERGADDRALNIYRPTSPLFSDRPIPPDSVIAQIKKTICKRRPSRER